nr:hypothetical protein [Tanacetum cinerariifolium]
GGDGNDCGGDGDEDGSVVEVMMAEWRWRWCGCCSDEGVVEVAVVVGGWPEATLEKMEEREEGAFGLDSTVRVRLDLGVHLVGCVAPQGGGDGNDCGGDGDEDGSVVEVMMAEWRWRWCGCCSDEGVVEVAVVVGGWPEATLEKMEEREEGPKT